MPCEHAAIYAKQMAEAAGMPPWECVRYLNAPCFEDIFTDTGGRYE